MDLSQEKEGRGLELTIHIEDKCQNDGGEEFEKADLPITSCPLKSTILFLFLSFTSTNPLLSFPKLEINFKYVHIYIFFFCKLKSSIITFIHTLCNYLFSIYSAPGINFPNKAMNKTKTQNSKNSKTSK